jgi:hypothetical protein
MEMLGSVALLIGVWLDGEWQWLGGSGFIRKRRSVRFEWWWFECGSGSIG